MLFRPPSRSLLVLWCALLCFKTAYAAPAQTAGEAHVTMLSDPHFDPFRDPSKVKRLDQAPVAEWEGILAERASPEDPAAYQKLQATCGEKGLDANNDLLQSAFFAATGASGSSTDTAKPDFVLVAGDLIVHQFDCRYRSLVADSSAGVAQFADKTINYVVTQLHARFPATPVYVALGNNDSGCGDYQLDPDSGILRNTSASIAQGWIGATEAERRNAVADYQRYGAYSLTMPTPMQHSRLIAFDDLFLSVRYKNCGGSAASQNATNLLVWLQQQLADAQAHHEHVWLLAHIPTGINTYATYLHGTDICGGAKPEMFLSSSSLDRLLLQYAGTIRLFVTGHTHLDEVHLEGHEGSSEDGVVMKTIPSISPISNNPPGFLTAAVDSASAVLLNYQLHSAAASTGKAIQWSTAYDFQKAYHEAELTPATISDLLHRFAGTQNGLAIENYQDHVASGLRLLAVKALWPQYVCSMQHSGPTAFRDCACAAQPTVTPQGQRAK